MGRFVKSFERPIVRIVAFPVILGAGNALLDRLNDDIFSLPIFLDMIGTLVATAWLGVVPGIMTATATHGFMELIGGFSGRYLPWVAVSLSSVLVLWRFQVRGWFSRPGDILSTGLAVAIVNAVIGGLVAALFFSGHTEHPVDFIAMTVGVFVRNLFATAFLARLPVNIIDKLLAVAIAYGVMRYAPQPARAAGAWIGARAAGAWIGARAAGARIGARAAGARIGARAAGARIGAHQKNGRPADAERP